MSRQLITRLVFLIVTIFAVLILFDSDMNLGRSNVTQAAELSGLLLVSDNSAA